MFPAQPLRAKMAKRFSGCGGVFQNGGQIGLGAGAGQDGIGYRLHSDAVYGADLLALGFIVVPDALCA